MIRNPVILLILSLSILFSLSANAESCISDCQCPPEQICELKEGKTSCVPAFCTEDFRPVCGFDGKTYSNACKAQINRVNIAHTGPCADDTCGGIEGKPCSEGEFCDPEPGQCGWMDSQGQCKTPPSSADECPEINKPVCGCDGVTYPNDCSRLAAMIPLDYAGPCRKEHTECRSNQDCAENQYCEQPCNSSGFCRVRPDFCIQSWDPVCGCDGKTYSNRCHAAAAGQSVRCDEACSLCSEASP